ncbi:helix-turn-helix transcriptional regulator [Niallia sp. Krafla_26]|uniref:helix-turn-helix transcriptional regulator n=1 Tax=Niallia sp. Krafla_26 TaxID=3064703 RepID=UPI003D16D094
MEQTLKITNVLSDPTRYYIYNYITTKHQEVTVQEIADNFNIHPNVARLHLTKLEDVNMLVSETKKTGKGGRPSRLYRLSNEVIQLHFPYRDYQLLSNIAIETMASLGEVGQKALYDTGRKFGLELIEQELAKNLQSVDQLTFDEKINIIKTASMIAGLSPDFQVSDDKKKVHFQIFNCPFKEVAQEHMENVCEMHVQFLKGMFQALFTDIELVEGENMLKGCEACTYQAVFAH